MYNIYNIRIEGSFERRDKIGRGVALLATLLDGTRVTLMHATSSVKRKVDGPKGLTGVHTIFVPLV